MRFAEIIELAKENGREDIVEFVNHEIELLDKKASNKTLTKTQVENIELMEVITEVLENLNKPLTISEMQEADEKLATLSKEIVIYQAEILKIHNVVSEFLDNISLSELKKYYREIYDLIKGKSSL